EIADELARLQKCAPDVVVSDKRMRKGNIEFFRESERSVISGIGYRHDNIGLNRKSARQFAAHFGADFADVHATEFAVRSREVDVLKHAECRLLRLVREFRTDSTVIDDQNLARFDVANEFRVNQIECTRL